jgi:hypothetical protein
MEKGTKKPLINNKVMIMMMILIWEEVTSPQTPYRLLTMSILEGLFLIQKTYQPLRKKIKNLTTDLRETHMTIENKMEKNKHNNN